MIGLQIYEPGISNFSNLKLQQLTVYHSAIEEGGCVSKFHHL